MKYKRFFKYPLTSAVVTLLLSMASVNANDLATYPLIEKESGKKIIVKVTDLKDGKISFVYKNQSFSLPIERFQDGTVVEVTSLLAEQGTGKDSEKIDFGNINKYIGHALFEDVSLWNEQAGDIAKRLKWAKESVKKYSSSYRSYPRSNYQFLGARPYCVTLYGGENDKPESLSLVFANKGDYGSNVGAGEDHFKKLHPEEELPNTLDEAIELDTKLISKTLTEALGSEPTKQRYGEKEDKRTTLRWDFEDHSFLLSSLEGEYVSLLIVPIANAEAGGKVKFVKDSDLRAQQLTNIVQEENGDVFIDNIPMVNQGPKGYCAPATFERAMSYMKIPADMYLLATAATTQAGTNTRLLAENCKRIIRSKARRIRDLDLHKDLKMKTVQKYIDKGVPVLWQMRSLREYNQLANKRSKQRAGITDFGAWATEISAEATEVSPQMLAQKENYHICMIIGYNEETQELAVSDSWGPAYELRWVHIDIAKAVTSSGGFVIDF